MMHNTSSMDRPVAATRKPRTIVIAVAATLFLAALALAIPAARGWWSAHRAVDAATLRLGTVTRGDLLRDLSVQGRVVASLSPTLFSPGQGIVSLRTHAGSQVKLGDILAVLDSKELHAALDQARSQLLTSHSELDRQRIVARQGELRAQQAVELQTLRLAAAQRQLERVQRTFKEGLSNKVDLETSQDAVRIADMELNQAKNELSLSHETNGFEGATPQQQAQRQESVTGELQKRVDSLTIRAPFDGMVAAVAVQEGNGVAPNQAVLTVVNLSSLELEIGLPEEYANETRVGTPALITFLNRDYPGKVTRISPEVVNNEVVATVAFDGEQPQGLKQNQRLTTRLTFESKHNVLKVARGAFLETEGGRAAYVVNEKMATRRDIVTGSSSVAEIEIVKGLNEGETVVLSDTSTFGHARTVMLR